MGEQMKGSYGGPGVDLGRRATGPGVWPYGGPAGWGTGIAAGPWRPASTARDSTSAPHRRRRRVIVALVAAGTAAALLIGAVAAWPSLRHADAGGSARSSDLPTGQLPPDPKQFTGIRAAVTAVFAARSAALRSGDLAAWQATVDPAAPDFLASETTLYENLRQLPLQSYTWAYDGQTQISGYPLPDSVTATLLNPDQTYSPGMTVTYQLRGFDQKPVTDSYVPVMVRRGQRWYVAADRTRAASFDQSFDEPWAAGPVQVQVSAHSLVVVSAGDATKLPALARQADAAVAAVTALWPTGWNHTVVLFATRDTDVFASFFGRTRAVNEASALTLGVGVAQHAPPTDDIRVVLNPLYSLPGDKDMPPLLRHEFTHVAQWNTQHTGIPRWAIEGIAEYTAYRHHVTQQRVSAQLVKDAKAHRMPASLPASDTFYGPEPGESYHYGMAWLAWEYMAETYGETKLKRVYARLALIDGPEDTAAALKAEAAAFPAVLGISEPRFVKNMEAWTAKVLRIV